jgi:fatty acid desaturase
MHHLLSIIHQAQQTADAFATTSTPEWLTAAILAYQAGTLTKKQMRKLKWKLAWQYFKSKLPFGKKRKGNKGLLILSIILGLACFGVAIWLGMLKEILILIGAVVLFFILFMGASAKSSS